MFAWSESALHPLREPGSNCAARWPGSPSAALRSALRRARAPAAAAAPPAPTPPPPPTLPRGARASAGPQRPPPSRSPRRRPRRPPPLPGHAPPPGRRSPHRVPAVPGAPGAAPAARRCESCPGPGLEAALHPASAALEKSLTVSLSFVELTKRSYLCDDLISVASTSLHHHHSIMKATLSRVTTVDPAPDAVLDTQ